MTRSVHLDATGSLADNLFHNMSAPPRRRVVVATARRPPAELRAIRVIFESDPDADASYLKHDGLEERLAAYEQNEFDFVWVRANAEVLIDGIPQTLTSGGMYAIESDSEEEYLDEIVAEEWKVLRGVLKTVGISTDKLPLEVEHKWIEWRI